MLAHMDIVSVNCPHTPGTFHLLSARRLGLLQPHVILVNTARGEVIDEAAMANMLAAGKLGGAGLDVYEHEPAINPKLLEAAQRGAAAACMGSAISRAGWRWARKRRSTSRPSWTATARPTGSSRRCSRGRRASRGREPHRPSPIPAEPAGGCARRPDRPASSRSRGSAPSHWRSAPPPRRIPGLTALPGPYQQSVSWPEWATAHSTTPRPDRTPASAALAGYRAWTVRASSIRVQTGLRTMRSGSAGLAGSGS